MALIRWRNSSSSTGRRSGGLKLKSHVNVTFAKKSLAKVKIILDIFCAVSDNRYMMRQTQTEQAMQGNGSDVELRRAIQASRKQDALLIVRKLKEDAAFDFDSHVEWGSGFDLLRRA